MLIHPFIDSGHHYSQYTWKSTSGGGTTRRLRAERFQDRLLEIICLLAETRGSECVQFFINFESGSHLEHDPFFLTEIGDLGLQPNDLIRHLLCLERCLALQLPLTSTEPRLQNFCVGGCLLG